MVPTSIVAAVLAIAAVAGAGRIIFRSWLHPGAFFALVWLFLVVFSLSAPVFGAERYPVWSGALWWMVLTLACVLTGSFIGALAAHRPHAPATIPTSGSQFEFVVPLLAVSALGSVVWPIAVPQLVVWGDHPPMYLQVFLGLHYLGPILGGLLFAGARETRHKLLALFTVLPGLLFGVLDTGRSKVVIQVCYWFSGYFTMLLFVRRGRPIALFSRGRTLAAIASLALFLLIGVVFTPFRSVPRDVPVGEKFRQYWQLLDSDTLLASWEWMHSSIFGHPAMFSSYFEIAWADPPTIPKFPQQTAAGVYRAFGYELPEPLYTEVGGEWTNVFTIFKPPIEDFTMPGALIIFFGWGALSAWAYRKVQLGSLWPGVLVAHYYANSMNIGGNFLTYNSQTGAFIIVGVYLWYLERHGSLRPHAAGAHTRRVAPRPTWQVAPYARRTW